MVFATTKIAKQLEKANGQTFATKFGTKMKELVVGDDGAVVGVQCSLLHLPFSNQHLPGQS
jgi:hypothetical protein